MPIDTLVDRLSPMIENGGLNAARIASGSLSASASLTSPER